MTEPTATKHNQRPHGSVYIDQARDLPADNDDQQHDPPVVASNTSGSSTEEESDEACSIDWPGDNHGATTPQPTNSPLSLDSEGADGADGGEEPDLDDWSVENEDWELAQGDFTKQYNRARQQHSAVYTGIRPSAGPKAGPSVMNRPPLPARNVQRVDGRPSAARKTRHPINTGIIVNPKSVEMERDKRDRATLDQVLDSRTRQVLDSLSRRGIINHIEYCISTGKEANVYYSEQSEALIDQSSPFRLAVKIYRTSILAFRSRKAYIEGEHRFRGEYTSSKNPRKMVRVWAEKELRNLRRLQQGGIRVPIAIEQRENVLVMEFLSTDDGPSPRLKDAELSLQEISTLYVELLVTMRRMYKHCKLVHADLSEYNVLLHDSHVYIIDVSQSVEHDHPRSYDLLRKDIQNVHDYFTRLAAGQVRSLTLRQTWDFITLDYIGLSPAEELGEGVEERMSGILNQWLMRTVQSEDDRIDDTVFMASFIPRNLGEVVDPERDVDILQSGNSHRLIYAEMHGLTVRSESVCVSDENNAVTGDSTAPTIAAAHDDAVGSAESETDVATRRSRGFRHEDKDTKKERKKAVKDEQRERRKSKLPKAEKQRLIKKSAGRG